jgi:hypothetical protein
VSALSSLLRAVDDFLFERVPLAADDRSSGAEAPAATNVTATNLAATGVTSRVAEGSSLDDASQLRASARVHGSGRRSADPAERPARSHSGARAFEAVPTMSLARPPSPATFPARAARVPLVGVIALRQGDGATTAARALGLAIRTRRRRRTREPRVVVVELASRSPAAPPGAGRAPTVPTENPGSESGRAPNGSLRVADVRGALGGSRARGLQALLAAAGCPLRRLGRLAIVDPLCVYELHAPAGGQLSGGQPVGARSAGGAHSHSKATASAPAPHSEAAFLAALGTAVTLAGGSAVVVDLGCRALDEIPPGLDALVLVVGATAPAPLLRLALAALAARPGGWYGPSSRRPLGCVALLVRADRSDRSVKEMPPVPHVPWPHAPLAARLAAAGVAAGAFSAPAASLWRELFGEPR